MTTLAQWLRQRLDERQLSQYAVGQPADHDDYLLEDLVDEFRKLPDDWKPEAINQLRLLVRLSTHVPISLPQTPPPATASTSAAHP